MTVAALLLLVAVHLGAWRLDGLQALPHSQWLSFAGGVAVAYVFVHMLPELAGGMGSDATSTNLHVVALAGLMGFHALEVRLRRARGADGAPLGGGDFALHAGSFAAYNLLIGYLLDDRGGRGALALASFAGAIALHFVATDLGLREHYARGHHRVARWLFAAALLAGFAVGRWAQLPASVPATLFAFVAGGMILNVFKDELPGDRYSRLLPFGAGAVGSAALLLAAG